MFMTMRCRGLALCLVVLALAGSQWLPGAARAEEQGIDLTLDPGTEIELETAVNGMPAQTKLVSSPSYFEYSLNPVVDGIRDRKGLNWQVCSWASAEEAEAHGIEIHLSKPRSGGRFQVTWAFDVHNADNGNWWVSRQYVVQVRKTADGEWETVANVAGNQSIVGSHQLPNKEFQFVRIVQPVGGGHPNRPNIMWVGQVELVD